MQIRGRILRSYRIVSYHLHIQYIKSIKLITQEEMAPRQAQRAIFNIQQCICIAYIMVLDTLPAILQQTEVAHDRLQQTEW